MVQNINVNQLHDMLAPEASNLQIVDVREPWEYAYGHVPRAALIPLNDLPQHAAELDAARPVAVICEHGVRSLYAASFLKQAGFQTVYNILGGTSAWVERGLPLER